jgi:hypothetical protein
MSRNDPGSAERLELAQPSISSYTGRRRSRASGSGARPFGVGDLCPLRACGAPAVSALGAGSGATRAVLRSPTIQNLKFSAEHIGRVGHDRPVPVCAAHEPRLSPSVRRRICLRRRLEDESGADSGRAAARLGAIQPRARDLAPVEDLSFSLASRDRWDAPDVTVLNCRSAPANRPRGGRVCYRPSRAVPILEGITYLTRTTLGLLVPTSRPAVE